MTKPGVVSRPPFLSVPEDAVRVAWCRDCDWAITADDLAEKAMNLRRANELVGSQSEGHAYFHRGHSIGSAYVSTDVHPDPFEDPDA